MIAALLLFQSVLGVYPIKGTLVHHTMIQPGRAPGTRIHLNLIHRGYLPESLRAELMAVCPNTTPQPVVMWSYFLNLFTRADGDQWTIEESVCPGYTAAGDHPRAPCRFTQVPLLQVFWRSWDRAFPPDGQYQCPLSR